MTLYNCKGIIANTHKKCKGVIGLAGQIYNMIQKIVAERSRGNQVIANSVRTKIILKGIAIDKYTPTSPDDFAVMQKLREVAQEYGLIV